MIATEVMTQHSKALLEENFFAIDKTISELWTYPFMPIFENFDFEESDFKQEAYCALCGSINKYNADKSSIVTFTYYVVSNKMKSYFKKLSSKKRYCNFIVSLNTVLSETEYVQSISSDPQDTTLESAKKLLQSLSGVDRKILTLLFYGESRKNVSKHLGIPLRLINDRLYMISRRPEIINALHDMI